MAVAVPDTRIGAEGALQAAEATCGGGAGAGELSVSCTQHDCSVPVHTVARLPWPACSAALEWH